MLRWLRAAFTLTLLCLSVFLGAVFATQNTISVPLNLGPWALDQQPMAVWLLSFLIVGVLLGSLMSSALVMRQRAASASLKRENARLSQRLNRDAKSG
jgi:putative membrane protein